MNRIKLFSFLFLITAMVFLLAKCKHSPTEEVLPKIDQSNNFGNQIQPPKDTLCFSSDILPMIISTCAKPTCHDAITHAEGLNLTNYANIMQGIVPGILIKAPYIITAYMEEI